MLYVKLKHFKVGYMMVNHLCILFFIFGLTHNFEINHWFLKNYAV